MLRIDTKNHTTKIFKSEKVWYASVTWLTYPIISLFVPRKLVQCSPYTCTGFYFIFLNIHWNFVIFNKQNVEKINYFGQSGDMWHQIVTFLTCHITCLTLFTSFEYNSIINHRLLIDFKFHYLFFMISWTFLMFFKRKSGESQIYRSIMLCDICRVYVTSAFTSIEYNSMIKVQALNWFQILILFFHDSLDLSYVFKRESREKQINGSSMLRSIMLRDMSHMSHNMPDRA